MSKKKIVHELAKEMGISNKELIARLEVVGVSGKKSVSGLTEAEVGYVTATGGTSKKAPPEVVASLGRAAGDSRAQVLAAAVKKEEPVATGTVGEDEAVAPIPLRDRFPEANKVYALIDGVEQYLPVSYTTTKDEVWQVYESFKDGVLHLPNGDDIKCTSVILGTHSAVAKNQTVFPETLKQYDPE